MIDLLSEIFSSELFEFLLPYIFLPIIFGLVITFGFHASQR